MRCPPVVVALIAAVAFASAQCSMLLAIADPTPNKPASTDVQRAPFHVETWAVYRYSSMNEGRNSSPAVMRRWVTYLDAPISSAVVRVCNVPGHPCFSVVYVDNSVQFFGGCGYSDPVINGNLKQQGTLPESSWLHKSSDITYGNRVFYIYNEKKCTASAPDTAVLVNLKSRDALAWMNAHYQREFGDSIPDYYMNDDIRTVNKFSGSSAYEYSDWVDMQNAEASWLAGELNRKGQIQKVFFNGCDRNPYVAPAVQLVKMRPNIMGCENENGVNADDIRNGRDIYMLDNCARVSLNPNGGIFINGPDEEGTASSPNIMARRQATAFNWLCYVPNRVIFWEQEEWGGQYVNVFPEEGVYTTQPAESMLMPGACPDATVGRGTPGNTGTSGDPCARHGHNDLLAPGTTKVFRREFGRCYNQGVAVGRCAVVWNMSDSAVTIRADWLKYSYAHMMTMNAGHDGHGTIEDGGTITLTTPVTAVGQSIAPYDAIFLMQ